MIRKGRGFPLEYYPVEILTDTEARENRKLVIVYVKKKKKSNHRSDSSLCCCENFHWTK